MSELPTLSSSMEDYLEAILNLERRNRVARVKEIAETLDVRMASVTGALKSLREKGLVDYEKNSYIFLTEIGRRTAESVCERHTALRTFLSETLALQEEEAEETACKIEHVASPELTRRLTNLTKYLDTHFRDTGLSRDQWIQILKEGVEGKS